MNITILDKYSLDIIKPQARNAEKLVEWDVSGKMGPSAGYIEYVLDAPKKVERNAACTEYIMTGLPKGLSVVEYFGGAGIAGVIIDHLLEPRSHKLFDIDPDCVTQLKHLFGENAQYGNAKEILGTVEADLVVMDFPYFTVNRENIWNIQAVFDRKPQYVTLADCAHRRLGIHREFYTKKFGTPIKTNMDYINAFSRYWYDKYGYSVRKCGYHLFSFILFTPEAPGEIEFKDVRK